MTKKLTLEQIAAVEVKRCEKVKKCEAMTGTKARYIRILPTKSQKLQLNKAFEACRWVYNKCAENVNSNSKKRKDRTKDLRARFVNNDAWDLITTTTDAEWANIPYEVRDGALRDAVKSVAAADALMEVKALEANTERADGWHFKFRRKKDITESIQLRSRNLNSKSEWFAALFGPGKMQSCHPLPAKFETDVRIFHDKRLQRHCLIVAIPPKKAQSVSGGDSHVPTNNEPMDVVMNTERETEMSVTSIDPGVRTFLTCFDPEGNSTKWGRASMLQVVVVGKQASCIHQSHEQAQSHASHTATHESCSPAHGVAHQTHGQRASP